MARTSTPSPPVAPPHEYRGAEWVEGRLPLETERWPKFTQRRLVELAAEDYDISLEQLKEYARRKPWVWPGERVYFLCDVHADADAFFTSLVASGGVAKTGPGDSDFELTAEGHGARFLIGGDLFDKGPCNLRLLDAVAALRRAGGDVEILAGNHDVRTLVGLRYAGAKDPRVAHLFVRMGQKTMPLLREIHDRYLAGGDPPVGAPSEAEIREQLFPDESWYEAFPRVAEGLIHPKKLAKELRRIREKVADIDRVCAKLGLTLSMLHRAVARARAVFLEPGGDYRWVFDEMRIGRRMGAIFFVHGGVDDTTARILREEGDAGLDRVFQQLMSHDLFELYHGPIGNSFRTKYREFDFPLTVQGVRDMHRAGIYAIVHGHRNITRGQRMLLRNGLLNFECDASVDRNTRRIEGLEGAGGAVTIIEPDGVVLGVSTDYPYIKRFDPASVFDMTTIA